MLLRCNGIDCYRKISYLCRHCHWLNKFIHTGVVHQPKKHRNFAKNSFWAKNRYVEKDHFLFVRNELLRVADTGTRCVRGTQRIDSRGNNIDTNIDY